MEMGAFQALSVGQGSLHNDFNWLVLYAAGMKGLSSWYLNGIFMCNWGIKGQ